MGFKRPFDGEDFQELPFKQTRQVDCSNKLIQFAGPTSKEPTIADYHVGSFEKAQQHDTLGNNIVCEVSNFGKGVELSTPRSLITSSSSDDDILTGVAAYSYSSIERSEGDHMQRLEPPEDVYSSYLDRSPTRHVPLGPNHQASIPVWVGHFDKNQLQLGDSSGLNSPSLLSYSNLKTYSVDEEKQMGICIVPLPDAQSMVDCSYTGGGDSGRTDCTCLDEGSVRCVRQHIQEAREKLKKSLGHEKFVNLGFCDMGEEVRHKWTEEEERVFHAVVYSNPASLGQNFWNHLSQVFSTRSSKEIVSYYFNVFMLRRLAAQNRSNSLDIDSDDDELYGNNRGSYKFQVLDEDDDSDIDSIDQCDNADRGVYTYVEEDEDKDDSDDDGSDEDGDLGDSGGDATGEDSEIDNVLEPNNMKSLDGSRFDLHADYKAGSVLQDFSVRDDSCMSFDFQADKTGLYGAVHNGAALELSRVGADNRDFVLGTGRFSDEVDQVYLLDTCDTKSWDTRYAVPTKDVSFLPTCNIIEEIFGQGTTSELNMK
ncbi:uncharacterized protein [Euphorbia lathyris]|uniref:uncharacterized protein n=1 Tax=Euphorbia lathyris TaxID=212925 RepID=UPI0033132F24